MPLIGDRSRTRSPCTCASRSATTPSGVAELSSGRAADRDRGHGLLRRPGRLHAARRDASTPRRSGPSPGRLGELAAEAVEPPVRLVKLIGDAAMLVGPEPAPVVEAALELVEAADAGGRGLPAPARRGRLRRRRCRGAATGTGARSTWRAGSPRSPGPAACSPSEEVQRGARRRLRLVVRGPRRLKGIDGSVKLYRCRRAD